jgi:hypothetical protein
MPARRWNGDPAPLKVLQWPQFSNLWLLVAPAFDAADPNIRGRASGASRPSVSRKINPQELHWVMSRKAPADVDLFGEGEGEDGDGRTLRIPLQRTD